MKICSYLKAVGILEHPQNWALCAGLVGYSMFYWLLKKTLRRAESGFEFTLHPQHFVILKLSIWEVMLFMETEDGTPVRMPRGEKHGGKWVKPTWVSCEQSHRKAHFILPWVRFCPMTITGHVYFWCHCGWRWALYIIFHCLCVPLNCSYLNDITLTALFVFLISVLRISPSLCCLLWQLFVHTSIIIWN